MTILLFILKIIGILLLSVIGMILLLLALVLCVPVRYHVEGSEEEERRIFGKVHWLLHVVSVSFSYEEKELGYSLRILGIPVLPRKKKKSALDDMDFEEDREEPPETAEDRKNMSGEGAEEPSETAGDRNTEAGISGEKIEKSSDIDDRAGNGEDTDTNPPTLAEKSKMGEPLKNGNLPAEDKTFREKSKIRKRSKGVSLQQKIRGFYEKAKQTINKIGYFLKQLPKKIEDIKKLLTDETNKKAVSLVWKEGKYLLHHSRLRKIKTDLTFSMGDPAATGQILGVLCMFPMLYQYEITICPDFEAEHMYIRGTYFIKGHIRLLHLPISGIRLWKEKDFRRFVKQILKKLER